MAFSSRTHIESTYATLDPVSPTSRRSRYSRNSEHMRVARTDPEVDWASPFAGWQLMHIGERSGAESNSAGTQFSFVLPFSNAARGNRMVMEHAAVEARFRTQSA